MGNASKAAINDVTRPKSRKGKNCTPKYSFTPKKQIRTGGTCKRP